MQIGDRTTIAGIVLGAAVALGTVSMPQGFLAAHESFRTTVLIGCFALITACVGYLCYLHMNWRGRSMPTLLMVLGATLFFAGAIWLGLVNERKIDKPNGQSSSPPTLFSLFMSDLQPSKGIIWNAFSDFDLGVGDKTEKVRIFYNIYDDFISHSKYIAFYVPAIFITGTTPSSQTFDIVRYIANSYSGLLRDVQENRWAEMKTLGDVSAESTRNVTFSGRIFFYCADNLSIELAELRGIYQEHGADAQFRGMDYALAVWDSIQLGRVKTPQQYEVQNGVPQLKN